jgi:hypothetical protein
LSAKSRASLRSQYKTKLEETRLAVEERRSKSPAISIPSQRSLEEDQLIEDDDDVALPDGELSPFQFKQHLHIALCCRWCQ